MAPFVFVLKMDFHRIATFLQHSFTCHTDKNNVLIRVLLYGTRMNPETHFYEPGEIFGQYGTIRSFIKDGFPQNSTFLQHSLTCHTDKNNFLIRVLPYGTRMNPETHFYGPVK